mmetsp:Transcript_60837/g.144983  ORF Transcript_60837/g.144983 Transcript_60837/m.144983 type:complete len:350 (+) Transcript_60837:70-1119(+)
MPIKQQVSQACTGHWKVGLFEAPGASPVQCLYGCCCPCCAAFQQRNTLLDITGEPYVCCAGLFPCCGIDKPQNDRNCLFLEACCCPGIAIAGNRFMVQTRFDKENTPCDDCILWTTCLCVYGIEIARCCGVDIPEELDCLVDCLVMSVNGCMHAQQHVEIQEIMKNGYSGPPPALMAALPPAQQQMIHAGKVSGGGGFVSQPAPVTIGGGSAKPQPVQQSMYSNAPPAAPQQQYAAQPQSQAAPIQIKCGNCGSIFGSPSYGVTVACPYCQAHNQVPPATGTVISASGAGGSGFGSSYSAVSGKPSSGYGGQPSGGQGGRPGLGAGAAAGIGAGAGVIGGLVLADALFG